MTTKRVCTAVVVIACLIATTVGGVAALTGDKNLVLGSSLDDLLTGIDYVPTDTDLDAVIENGGVETLRDYAGNHDSPGVRVAALRALMFYDDVQTRDFLLSALQAPELIQWSTGVHMVYARATLESLAEIGQHTDDARIMPAIAALLDHRCDDVVAGAARALATLGDRAAEPWLRDLLRDGECLSAAPQIPGHVCWAAQRALISLATQ